MAVTAGTNPASSRWTVGCSVIELRDLKLGADTRIRTEVSWVEAKRPNHWTIPALVD